MSFWGATVIIQLISVMPVIGPRLVIYIWGGFETSRLTLGRFFVIHYMLPFVILGLVLTHIAFMHSKGVNLKTNLANNTKGLNLTTLQPYYILKDYVVCLGIILLITYLISYYPERFANPSNNHSSLLSSSTTPPHIVPEWYFLPLYAILKSVPSKACGILLMFLFLASPLLDLTHRCSFIGFIFEASDFLNLGS